MWQGDGKSLDIVNDSINNNQPILAETGDYSGQYWKITPVKPGYYRLTTMWQGDEKSLDIVNDGRSIDFKNTVLFLTSNLANELITEEASTSEEQPSLESLIEKIRPILSKHFKPALLARMEIVPFTPIQQEAMSEIVKIKLQQLAQRLQDSQKIQFVYQDAVVDQIAQRCTEVETGARNIDHIINRTLLPRIASEVLMQMSQASLPETLEVGIDEAGDFTYEFRE
jgi:type VI secretion system protein VasG